MTPLQRIGQALAEMRVVANASGRAYDREPIKGGEGDGLGPPGSFTGELSLFDEWIGRLERIAEVMDHEVALARNRYANPRWRGRERAEDRDQRILRMYEGREVALAAYIEGCAPRTIERVRERNGRRVSDGRPL